MNPPDLPGYRLNRARETLEEARLMLDAGHSNACVNRLYYACFYAVSALLALHGRVVSKHSGVRSLFGQLFVRTGLIAREHGAFYNTLFDTRQESDYADFFTADRTALPGWMEQATRFVEAVASLISMPGAPPSP